MKAFWALYRATARQFRRDRMAFLFTVLLPLLMAAFFGLTFSQPARYHLTLGLAVAAALLQALEPRGPPP